MTRMDYLSGNRIRPESSPEHFDEWLKGGKKIYISDHEAKKAKRALEEAEKFLDIYKKEK